LLKIQNTVYSLIQISNLCLKEDEIKSVGIRIEPVPNEFVNSNFLSIIISLKSRSSKIAKFSMLSIGHAIGGVIAELLGVFGVMNLRSVDQSLAECKIELLLYNF